MNWFLGLKPSRRFLAALIAAALIGLVAALLGYRPASLPALNATARSEFMTSVIAVVATFVGVAVAGWVTLEQLDSEREDRRKERQLATKHAVLIDALRGFKEMISQFGRLPSLETTHAEISQAFTAGASQAQPAWAVADLPTVSLLQLLSNDVSATFMRLVFERGPIVKLAQRGKALNDSIQQSEEYVARLAQAESDANAVHDFAKTVQITQLKLAQIAIISKLKKESEELHAQFTSEHLPFALRCIFESRRLHECYRRLCGCVRLEVHVAAEDETYEDFCNAADLQDAKMIQRIKAVYPPEHHALIEKLARDAGCQMA